MLDSSYTQGTIDELRGEGDASGLTGLSSHVRIVSAAIDVASWIGYMPSDFLPEESIPINPCAQTRECNTFQPATFCEIQTFQITAPQQIWCCILIWKVNRPHCMDDFYAISRVKLYMKRIWTILLAGRLYPPVIFASPVLQPIRRLHSMSKRGPAALWIAPSTPPPPKRDLFAALTMTSIDNCVISPLLTCYFNSGLSEGIYVPYSDFAI